MKREIARDIRDSAAELDCAIDTIKTKPLEPISAESLEKLAQVIERLRAAADLLHSLSVRPLAGEQEPESDPGPDPEPEELDGWTV